MEIPRFFESYGALAFAVVRLWMYLDPSFKLPAFIPTAVP